MKCDKCQSEVSADDTQQIKTNDGLKNVCDDCVEDFMSCDMFGIAGDFNKDLRGIQFKIRTPYITINDTVIPGMIVEKISQERGNRYLYDPRGYYNASSLMSYPNYNAYIQQHVVSRPIKAEVLIDGNIIKLVG